MSGNVFQLDACAIVATNSPIIPFIGQCVKATMMVQRYNPERVGSSSGKTGRTTTDAHGLPRSPRVHAAGVSPSTYNALTPARVELVERLQSASTDISRTAHGRTVSIDPGAIVPAAAITASIDSRPLFPCFPPARASACAF